MIEKGGLESTFFHLFLTQEQLAMCGVGIAGEGSISPNTPEGKWRKRKNKKEVPTTKHQTVLQKGQKMSCNSIYS